MKKNPFRHYIKNNSNGNWKAVSFKEGFRVLFHLVVKAWFSGKGSSRTLEDPVLLKFPKLYNEKFIWNKICYQNHLHALRILFSSKSALGTPEVLISPTKIPQRTQGAAGLKYSWQNVYHSSWRLLGVFRISD